ncbi:hypothetical protein [Schwartzia sp. (in: firmicutes)]
MRNTILLDSTMRSVNMLSTLENAAKAAQNGTASYKEIMAAIQKAAGKTVATSKDTSEMTFDEYKDYIESQVNAMQMDDSRANDTVSIEITDGGFRAMQKDPLYEQWVLDSIRSALVTQNRTASLTGGSYVMLKYGQTRENYRAESWGKESQALFNAMSMTKGKKSSSSSFWMKRASQMTQNLLLTSQLARQKINLQTTLAKALGNSDSIEVSAVGGEAQMKQTSVAAAYWMYLMQQSMTGLGF